MFPIGLHPDVNPDLRLAPVVVSIHLWQFTQQHLISLQGEAFLLFSQVLMMAAAQPTPGVTAIALVGQFVAQAPHSMHPL